MSIIIVNQYISRHYRPLSQIGQGRYSNVYLVQKTDNGHKYALKTVQTFGLCQFEIQNSLREALLLFFFNHPNIIKIQECIYDANDDILYLVLEYAEKGDLQTLLQIHKDNNSEIKESLLWKIVIDVTSALHYAHSMDILHGDVKPANIFVGKEGFKLGDFNISQIGRETSYRAAIGGTMQYSSPQKIIQKKQDPKSDVWSLGILCYELCCLSHPHSSKNIEDVDQFFKRRSLSFDPIPSFYSQTLQQLISSLLKKIDKRPTTAQILEYCGRCGISSCAVVVESIDSLPVFLRQFDLKKLKGTVDVFQQYFNFQKSKQKSYLLSEKAFISVDHSKSSLRSNSKRKIVRLKRKSFHHNENINLTNI